MAKKVTLGTLEAVLSEVDKANDNRDRVISDIQNRDARQIIQNCSDYALKHGIDVSEIAAGLGVRGVAGGIAAGLGAAGVAGGIAAGLGAAGAVGGIGGAAAGGGLAFAAAGAAAGAPVPIVGPLIGAGVGLLIGGIFGGAVTAKQKQKRECLYQEAIAKQNGAISALVREVQNLQDKINKKDAEIARLKYLMGVLSATAALAPS